MTTERMSGLGLMNAHRDRELNAARVVDLFAQKRKGVWHLSFMTIELVDLYTIQAK